MTAQATTERRDAKAGFCSNCRQNGHALCASPTCTCIGFAHRNRPSTTRPAAAPTAPAAAPKAKSKAAKVQAVWELVKEAPAAPPPKKLTPAQRAQPFLEAITEAEDGDWHRIALFGTPHAAGRAKAVLAKEFGEGWEWTSGRDSQHRPAVFVRKAE